MVVLKKVRASSLMETLVATVLIVIIFMVSSMVLNNIVSSNIRNNTALIETHLSKLEYEYKHGAIALPYSEDFEEWEITISQPSTKQDQIVLLEAVNSNTEISLTKTIIGED